MNSKEILYSIKPSHNRLFYLLFIILFGTIIYYSLTNYTYEQKSVVGINECREDSCEIKLTLNYEEISILNKNPIIYYNKKEYQIKSIKYDEPYLNNGIPSSDITIRTEKISDSNILEFSILYNKEKIAKKIKNIIERN